MTHLRGEQYAADIHIRMVRLAPSQTEDEGRVESKPIRVKMQLAQGITMTAYVRFVARTTRAVLEGIRREQANSRKAMTNKKAFL